MAEVINMVHNRTGLKPETKNEEIILAYVEANASDTLVKKIIESKKSLSQCMAFIKTQARSKAKNGVAMIEDEEVFGWAMHFFEEDSIKGDGKNGFKAPMETKVKVEPKKVEVRTPEVKKPEPKDKQLEGQLDIFSLLGGTT